MDVKTFTDEFLLTNSEYFKSLGFKCKRTKGLAFYKPVNDIFYRIYLGPTKKTNSKDIVQHGMALGWEMPDVLKIMKETIGRSMSLGLPHHLICNRGFLEWEYKDIKDIHKIEFRNALDDFGLKYLNSFMSMNEIRNYMMDNLDNSNITGDPYSGHVFLLIMSLILDGKRHSLELGKDLLRRTNQKLIYRYDLEKIMRYIQDLPE